MKVYFISGLGADRHVFRYLKLPEHCEAVHLDWIQPGEKESLNSYALRLAERIDCREPFSLLGLSFGGMLAVEISKQLSPAATILISSIPCSDHLPKYFRLAAFFQLHRIVPISMIRKAAILKRYFTAESASDKIMLKKMIRESDSQFIRWAFHAALTWDCREAPRNLYHLHGTRDEVFPKIFTRPTHLIPKGSHLMVLTRAGEINSILKEILSR